MAVYNDSSLIEQPIYGSSRLGQYLGYTATGKRTLGNKNYELTNHLGNVLTVVTDNISMSTIDTIRATVASASDYYPFGLQMPGRMVSDTVGYRYGFNGKERDPASEWGQTSYDYGFRIYNPSIARFLSVDPLTKSYPWYTPYQFAGNKPIEAIDLDGLEELSNKVINDVRFIELKNVNFKMVIRQSTESLTTAMDKSVESGLDNYSINTQMGEPVPGTNPKYATAFSPQPNYRSQGYNIVNGNIVGGRSSKYTWHLSIDKNDGVSSGMGNPDPNSQFAMGGATPMYVNGLRYGETNIWKANTPENVTQIAKGAVAQENMKWLDQKSNGVYAGQNDSGTGKTILGYNSSNKHWMIVSQENEYFGGMTYDEIRDNLIGKGYDLILGFDGSNSSILRKNAEGLTNPATQKDNTMPAGATLTVPKN